MLMDTVLNYLKAREIVFSDRYMPYYVASAACHLCNIVNKEKQFYLESGAVPDLRLQIFLVSPPGYMKSFFLKILLDGPTSVFGGSIINTAFQGSMTEAGFVGTVKFGADDEPTTHYGAAYEYSHHIVGIEEFNALTNAMKQEHSSNLDNALLTALDSGMLVKRLGPGEISYSTNVTLFSGSQPARFDLSSGLGRRFLFIYFIPSKEEKELIRAGRRRGKGVRGKPEILLRAQREVEEIDERVKNIT
ncbi:MAG: hypothetical protein KKC55_16400, partial [Gammaproteobacteria bacterium]|nr:hypothetical protein [Gammaproteobacteria bacterium]